MTSERNLPTLSEDKRAVVAGLVSELEPVPGLVAIALGGSHAVGAERPDSDVDLGLYYRESEPLGIGAIREVAARFDGDAAVTELWEWGRWVNGGAWLQTEAGRVDLLYRSLEHVERVIARAHEGLREWDYAQQPVYGFHSVIYLAETHVCVPLWDPEGALERLKKRVASYPDSLRASMVQDCLWSAEFTLRHARALAARGDVYNTVGCLTRMLGLLSQVLFALNRCYFLNDKRALETIEGFELCPDRYAERVRALLSAPGAGAEQLVGTTSELEDLFKETVELAGPLYRSRYP